MITKTDMATYLCTKEVKAFKIDCVVTIETVEGTRTDLVEANGDSYGVPQSWVLKHMPKPGGYYVCYQDGYESYSPAKAFEDGYILKTVEG